MDNLLDEKVNVKCGICGHESRYAKKIFINRKGEVSHHWELDLGNEKIATTVIMEVAGNCDICPRCAKILIKKAAAGL